MIELEQKVENIETRLNEHISQFDNHKKDVENWQMSVMELIKQNEATNKKLVECVSKVEENTRPWVKLSEELEAAGDLTTRVRKAVTWLWPFMALLGAVYLWAKELIK